MKKVSMLLAWGLLNSVNADSTFSVDRLKTFNDVFICEEKDEGFPGGAVGNRFNICRENKTPIEQPRR